MIDERKDNILENAIGYCVDLWINYSLEDVVRGLHHLGLTEDETIEYLVTLDVANSGEEERELKIALEKFYPEETKALNGYTKPTIQEVVNYLEEEGTDVCDENIDFFRDDCPHLAQAWETIHEGYCLVDVDRWMLLEDILGVEFSWNCYLKIDSAFYNEDLEILEMGYDKENLERELAELKRINAELKRGIINA